MNNKEIGIKQIYKINRKKYYLISAGSPLSAATPSFFFQTFKSQTKVPICI